MKRLIFSLLLLLSNFCYGQIPIDKEANIFTQAPYNYLGYSDWPPFFTKEDSLKCDVLSTSFHIAYKHFKVADTITGTLKVWDENGYLRRINAYKLIYSRIMKLRSDDGDMIYTNPMWQDESVEYLTMDKRLIPLKDIEF